jgi:predicted nuclease with TOPRIM domain
MENYLSAMEDGLEKKIKLLTKISEINASQKTALEQERLDLEAFDATVEEKGKLVDELVKLDNGFQAVYDRVKEQLATDKSAYAEQIRRMKALITRVTDLSVQVQSEEARNKELVQKQFGRLRQGVVETRKNSKAVSNYYRSMSKLDSSPQFLDSKK